VDAIDRASFDAEFIFGTGINNRISHESVLQSGNAAPAIPASVAAAPHRHLHSGDSDT